MFDTLLAYLILSIESIQILDCFIFSLKEKC